MWFFGVCNKWSSKLYCKKLPKYSEYMIIDCFSTSDQNFDSDNRQRRWQRQRKRAFYRLHCCLSTVTIDLVVIFFLLSIFVRIKPLHSIVVGNTSIQLHQQVEQQPIGKLFRLNLTALNASYSFTPSTPANPAHFPRWCRW